MEEIAAQNKQVYDRFADRLIGKYDTTFPDRVKAHAQRFMDALSGKTVLDVGAGSGTHAEFFYHLGLDVTCVDISESMLKKCESKGLKTLMVDLQEMHFPPRTIDGIWAVASLIHVRKAALPGILKNWHRMLKPNAIAFIAVKEGAKEGFMTTKDLPEAERWFAFYEDEEMRSLLAPYFEVVFFSREKATTGTVWLNYLLRKR